ncbi:unnamed protein product [Rotaria socialis]|uniref:Uncharacterized protein n=1 Tax=Rotaria socialis TaxID=392032 RepID=A0A817LCX2_9BILA|nr:unnamed protein product [Rotaria socialis]CAF3438642.1 unnamed protein product [Rotaria socialis]CAF3459041.1 unnamed protein product [Rotaria socialis]CAF3470831.1 unnamed protein product [Rotaria socialis]CAF3494506.1 unnamed protein product [Rotaria socialis]
MSKNQRRRKNKEEKEQLYEQLFVPYEPKYQYDIYFINTCTTLHEFKHLINIAQQTNFFTIDTESDYLTNIPALIQIYFLNGQHILSPLLLIEAQFLPNEPSCYFSNLQELFSSILRSDAHIYCWGSIIPELTPFLCFNFFSFPITSFLHNSQTVFRTWFDDWLNFHTCIMEIDSPDVNDDSLIIHAPTLDPDLILPPQIINNLKVRTGELWSLQDAVVYIFQQYLSKRDTLRRWSIGLDNRLTNSTRSSTHHRSKLIKYAAYDCLSLAQLVVFMYQSHLSTASTCIQYSEMSGEYLIIRDNDFFDYFFTTNQPSDSHVIDECPVTMMAVHEIDERCPTPSPNITTFGTIPSDLIPYIETTPPDTNLHLDTTTSHSNKNASHRTRKQSSIARQKRNKKSSLRHRRNRYNYEIIRPVNIDISSVKNLLRANHIQYININIVKSILYIGVKSDGWQKLYEHLIPPDMFV